MQSRLSAPLFLSFCFGLFGCNESPCGVCPTGSTCGDDLACHCGEGGPRCETEDVCDLEHRECVPPIPEAICGSGAPWVPGQSAFVDATSAWGLDTLGVLGVRMTVADIDGDHFPDLEVRHGALSVDTPEARRTWLLRNRGDGTFEDVTEASAILTRRIGEPGGRPVQVTAWADVDNDGDVDLYSGVTTADRAVVGMETSELLLNNGQGVFTLGPADSPLRRAEGVDVPAGASFFDGDHDGVVDLFVVQHNFTSSTGAIRFRNDSLYRGDGGGRFDEVTAAAGMITEDWISLESLNAGLAHTRAWSAAACDLNGDGWAELLSASYGRAPNHLWQAAGPMQFINRSVASGYAYDDDFTWQDNQFARCFCQANPAAEDCAGVPPSLLTCGDENWSHDQDREPFRLGGNSGATLCGDLDNDGDLDLLTSEIRHWWAGTGADGGEVLVNDGTADPVFARPGDEALGLAIDHGSVSWDEGHMTGALLDFDNDGRLDIYIGGSDYAGNRGLLYHQEPGFTFREVSITDGIDHNRSHGVVVADFDRDGDLDVVVGHSRARCDATAPNDCYPTAQVRFFENVLADRGTFVQLDLEGIAGTNRDAIGARVRVTAGELTQTQEVSGGHGHYGTQNEHVLHFGLGAECEAQVEIRWPDAALTTQTFTVPAGHRYHVRQGAEPVFVR